MMEIDELAGRSCMPCRGGEPSLQGPAIAGLTARLGGGWAVIENHHLEKTFRFRNFQKALDFTNAIGRIAEEQGHHPDVGLAWGRVVVTLWTHKAGGLTENDFILAAKIDRAYGTG
jgi:4a-hydroxytetrahydrobiopterin dehydratase